MSITVPTEYQVRMHLLHEREVSLGVERIWQMSCTLPASLLASFGLLVVGRAMVQRLQRMSGLSLSGVTTSAGSWVAPQDGGSYLAVMMVTQLESASEVSQERLRLENSVVDEMKAGMLKIVTKLPPNEWRQLNGGKPIA